MVNQDITKKKSQKHKKCRGWGKWYCQKMCCEGCNVLEERDAYAQNLM